ncbi:MAG: acylneuraminate cytidylyltransferase family protein [Candidatus Omnitrophica bacterium]|nr:acylneuraminate cytidylyltransferase family protein [Candidatus Omnitrophota bacterium]
MTSKKNCLALIPARGSSKSIPRKNIKLFNGKPLLAWTIECAQESNAFERIILSTDDQEIAELGKKYKAEVPFLRPEEFATDAAPTALAVRHALEWLWEHQREKPDFVMVLEPTSPLRQPSHIQEALKLLSKPAIDSVASVSRVPQHYVPEKILKIMPNGVLLGLGEMPIRRMIHRRQDLPVYYGFNGLIFACRRELLFKNPPTLWGDKVFPLVTEDKYTADLDNPEDWLPAEAKMRDIFQERLEK